MNKQELLQQLSAHVSAGNITRDEVLHALQGHPSESQEAEKHKALSSFSVTKVLYALGAIVVVIGIVFFIAQVWVDIGALGRVGTTLGLGLLMTAIGSVLAIQKGHNLLGNVFHGIGGLLIPSGALVALSELGADVVTLWPVAITFGAICISYILLSIAHKYAILTFFAIANGTAFLYLFVAAATEGMDVGNVYSYLTMVVGVSYMLLGYMFRSMWNKALASVLYFFGITAFLWSAIFLVPGSVGWELVYPLFLIAGFLASVYVKSRSVLVVSALFLIVYMIYLTERYFADSIGWPLSLIILGFLFIGLGYVSVSINKKYINKKT